MTSPEGREPSQLQLLNLYRRVNSLAVEAGETIIPRHFSATRVVRLGAIPLAAHRRFPPDFADLTPYFILTATSIEKEEGPTPLLGLLGFRRFEPPTTPNDEGFRNNSWTVRYRLKGDPSNFDASVSLNGVRSYAFPPDPDTRQDLSSRGLSILQDALTDEGTAELPPPDGFSQPPLYAAEIGDLIGFTDSVLLGARLDEGPVE